MPVERNFDASDACQTARLQSARVGFGAELFVVEGYSASRAVYRVRNRRYQAVLPMQGIHFDLLPFRLFLVVHAKRCHSSCNKIQAGLDSSGSFCYLISMVMAFNAGL